MAMPNMLPKIILIGSQIDIGMTAINSTISKMVPIINKPFSPFNSFMLFLSKLFLWL